MARPHDPMRSVARIRRVRERDSLLGLHQAREESATALRRQQDLERRLAAPQPTGVAVETYAAQRLALVALEQAGTTARAATQSAEAIAETAQAHWQVDRVRLEAIEMLLARRAEARRQAALQREARENDDLGLQAWARRAREAS